MKEEKIWMAIFRKNGYFLISVFLSINKYFGFEKRSNSECSNKYFNHKSRMSVGNLHP